MTIRLSRPLSAVFLLGFVACGPVGTPDLEERVVAVEAALIGTDLTPTLAANVTDLRNTPLGVEGLDKIYDNNVATKLFLSKNSNWFQYRLLRPAVIGSYSITSANDFDYRDPKNWTVEGSIDGVGWTVLDSRQNQAFTARAQTREFTFTNSTAYLFYRLNISDNLSDSSTELQFAEFRIGGTSSTGTLPGTPVVVATPVVNSAAITVTWSAAANATGYKVQRVTDDGSATVEFSAASTSYTDTNLVPGTTYLYQVQAVNGTLRGLPSTTYARATTPGFAPGSKDITALSSSPVSDQYGTTGFEGVEQLTDNDPYSKYLKYGASTGWFLLQTPADAVVTTYTLTSANDIPERDPQSWNLEGSADGTTWTSLDSRSNQGFTARRQKRTYTCNPGGLAYRYYRLTVTSNRGAPDLQLAEWRLFGTSNTNLAPPAAPAGVIATALSGNQIRLVWSDLATQVNPEASYQVDRATNSTFTANLVSKTAGANSTEFRATGLAGSTTYYFRVAASNAAGPSSWAATVNATTPSNTPPTSFVENGWYGKDVGGVHYGHDRTVYRTYMDSNVAVYFDQYVPNRSSITWLNPIISEAWGYVKTTYGSFGDPYLYVIGNQDSVPEDTHDVYNVAGLVTAYSADGPYRNLIFSPSNNWMDSDPTAWNLASLTHELGHVVEFLNNDVSGSPAFNIWGDSKWCDIFAYDLYLHMTSVPPSTAIANYNENIARTDDFGRFWFRDWTYPLYNGNFGNTGATKKGTAFLVNFFQLLTQNLPKINGAYGPELNLGEYVHFAAGAAGVDLEDEAKVAFRWTPLAALQLARAQVDYPAVTALYRSNAAPGFTFDPIALKATVNAPLSGQTLVGTASDPNVGNTLTYSKVSGAAWLTVASNGALTGTPTTTGTSTAVVRVTDQGGLFDDATVSFTVLPAPTTLLNEGFETSFGAWSTDWDRANDQMHAGGYAARCGASDNDLTTAALNTSGKQRITITFWYRDSAVDEDDEVYLKLYNGTSFVNRFELGNSTEGTWNQYTVTLDATADASFFRSNFQIRFAGASVDTSELFWIDDVQVTVQ